MENQIQEQLLTWINTSLEAISINLEVLRKSEDKETVRKIEEKINNWFFNLKMDIQKTPEFYINLDYSPNVDYSLVHSDNSSKVNMNNVISKLFPDFDKSQQKQAVEFLDKLDSLNADYDVKDQFFLCLQEAYRLGKIDQEKYRDYLNRKNH